jgi:DNA polymerase-2
MRGDADADDSEVEYVMTTRGPEPLEGRNSPIDIEHYTSRQLEPVCDVVLPFLGTSYEKIAGAQRSLF